MDKEALIKQYDMQPHPEGGWYRELWQSSRSHRGQSLSSLTYYLIGRGESCAWHRLTSEEVWLWHQGAPLQLLLGGQGSSPQGEDIVTLGDRIFHGIVPPNTWQRARTTGDFTLVSCVVTPAYREKDWQLLKD